MNRWNQTYLDLLSTLLPVDLDNIRWALKRDPHAKHERLIALCEEAVAAWNADSARQDAEVAAALEALDERRRVLSVEVRR
jgi:hypothetical protein